MVTCERCHRNFVSYAALSQHFSTKHSNAARPPELERGLAAEKELEGYKATVHHVRGPSMIKLGAFILILIVAVGVIGYVALTPSGQTAGGTQGTGATAPDFTLPNVNGGTFTLSSYRAKANVLLFFHEGLDCQPCLRQVQESDGLQQQLSSLNVVVVSISTDQLNLLTEWARTSGPSSAQVLSDQNLQVSRAYDMLGAGVSMMPGSRDGHSFVLVNKSGVIIWRQDYGPSTMYVPNDQLIAAVRKSLGG